MHINMVLRILPCIGVYLRLHVVLHVFRSEARVQSGQWRCMVETQSITPISEEHLASFWDVLCILPA